MIPLRDAAERISSIYPTLLFDHRRFLSGTQSHPDHSAHMTERYRVEYACFKFAVAKVLTPNEIVEIGVRGGISACAFLSARPFATYLGIDNDADSASTGIDFSTIARRSFMELDVRASIKHADSQSLDSIPQCDLAHIDGDHSFESVRHDVTIAWRSGASWILCDDTDDSAVAAGIFHALRFDLNRGGVEWAHFPAWTGNILIRTDLVRPKV